MKFCQDQPPDATVKRWAFGRIRSKRLPGFKRSGEDANLRMTSFRETVRRRTTAKRAAGGLRRVERERKGLASALNRCGDYIVQRFISAVEKAADATRRLADALLVLDQRQTDIIVAMLAEAYARRHCDIGLFDQ
jgi:hypothetical protein